MEKKYQVFVSSTFEDLKEERAEVIKALLEMDCFPCGMEFFPAANEDSWSYIEKLIKECDYYIVIVAGRYGSMTEEGMSYTEKEYECALKHGIPVLAFVHATPEELPVKKTERNVTGQEKLESFIKKLQRRLYSKWTSREELNSRVMASMYKLMKSTPRTGWIPANLAADPNDLMEKVRLANQVQELKEELSKYKNAEVVKPDPGLSSGSDVFSAEVTYEEPGIGRDCYAVKTVKMSWDEIFKMISPSMANGCPVEHLDKTIDNLYVDCFNRDSRARQYMSLGERYHNVKLSLESLNTIKAQFLALGLIRTDDENSKTNGRWYLTRLGKEKMIQLSALRKPTKTRKKAK